MSRERLKKALTRSLELLAYYMPAAADTVCIDDEDYAEVRRLRHALLVEPNEARELCFARVILGNQIVSDEVRALAEDTVAKAKSRARKR